MTRDVSDVTHRKRGLRFEKSQLVEFLARKKTVDFRGRTCWGGGRWKSQHRKIVPLSLSYLPTPPLGRI